MLNCICETKRGIDTQKNGTHAHFSEHRHVTILFAAPHDVTNAQTQQCQEQSQHFITTQWTMHWMYIEGKDALDHRNVDSATQNLI